MPSFIFLKKFQCFFRVFLKETYPSCQNKISPQSLCWGRNLRREFLEACFHNWSHVSAKINTPIRNTNFSKQNKETFIHKAENSPGQCWSKSLLWFWLIWRLSGSKVSAKIDRTSFSMVLTIFTFTLSTIYSFTEVYFTSITSRDGAEILETKKFRKFSSITQVNALQTSSLLLKFHWHPDQTQSLNRGFNTLLRTGTLIKWRAVQAEH